MKLNDSYEGSGTVRRRLGRKYITLALAMPVLALMTYMITRPAPPKNDARELQTFQSFGSNEEYHNTAGFVGPEKCVNCHADRVHAFKESRHYLACVQASSETMPGSFSADNARYTPHESDVTFEMLREADSFVQVSTLKSHFGVRETRTPISMLYGYGGETDEVYFSWKDNRLYELPISWLHPSQEWGAGGFDRIGTGDFSRPTNPRCVECHNTWLEHIPGTSNEYRPESLIQGVTCEVCHGPARDHVSFHELHPESSTPMHIVQPAQLSRSLKMDLCANCHSNALKHRGAAFSYRPGLPLSDFYQSLQTVNPEDDHVANQTAYLQQSKCFQESETLTCITCHDPHAARETQQRGSGRSACLSCHHQQNCTEQPGLPEAVKDNCVGCHMPRKSKVQVNFDTARDRLLSPVPRWEHRIAIDIVARDEVLLEWYRSQPGEHDRAEAARLSVLLAATYDENGDRLTSQFRFLAAADEYRKSLSLSVSPNVQKKFEDASSTHIETVTAFTRAEHDLFDRRIEAGMQTLERLLSIKPDHSRAHGRLGTFYAMKGDDSKAIEHWSKVVSLDPNDAYGEGMIGWSFYLNDQAEKAVEVLLRAEKIEPYSFRINYNLGLSLVKLNRPTEAAARFQRANQIEPQNVECGLLVNEWLRENELFQNAAAVVEKLSERTNRRNPRVEIARADSLIATGEFELAVKTLVALKRTIAGGPQGMDREIEERLQQLSLHGNDGQP